MRLPLFRRVPFRFWQTALPLVLLPVAELALLVYVFKELFTILTVLVCGLIGAFLAHRTGVRCWIELNRQLDRGEMPTVPALNGVLILLAAFLLILPGLLTSLIGLVLFIPLTRTFIISYIVLRFNAQRLQTQQRNATSPADIIDI